MKRNQRHVVQVNGRTVFSGPTKDRAKEVKTEIKDEIKAEGSRAKVRVRRENERNKA